MEEGNFDNFHVSFVQGFEAGLKKYPDMNMKPAQSTDNQWRRVSSI